MNIFTEKRFQFLTRRKLLKCIQCIRRYLFVESSKKRKDPWINMEFKHSICKTFFPNFQNAYNVKEILRQKIQKLSVNQGKNNENP